MSVDQSNSEPLQTPFVDTTPAPVSSGLASLEFAENPEPRCACLLLLDTSLSMSGEPIRLLNEGLIRFKDELAADPLARKRVEVGVIAFGGSVQVLSDFSDAMSWDPPALTPDGNTPMGEAITRGLQELAARKAEYDRNGITRFRPWVWLLTDGGPTDSWQAAAQQVRDGESRNAFSFYAIGVGNQVNMDILTQISTPSRPPVRLDGLRFHDMFAWLSKSMKTVSSSTPGQQVNLAAPGWITAST